MRLNLKFREQLNSVGTWLTTELDQILAAIRGSWLVEHTEDDQHSNIHAYSLTLTKNANVSPAQTGSIVAGGDITSGGSGTFAGDVTAQNATSPVVIGVAGPINGPGIRMRTPVTPTATDNDWALFTGAGTARTLMVRDALEVADVAMLDIIRTGASAYDVRPHTGAITLSLGGAGGAGPQWSEVNGKTVRPSILLDLICGQIKFPATQNPSADANTLDDYEEGTFNFTDTSGAGLAFVSAGGIYVKIGRVVIIEGQIIYPATASGLPALIGGFPFTWSVNGGMYLGFTSVDMRLWLIGGTANMQPLTPANVAITNAGMSNSNFVLQGIYLTT